MVSLIEKEEGLYDVFYVDRAISCRIGVITINDFGDPAFGLLNGIVINTEITKEIIAWMDRVKNEFLSTNNTEPTPTKN